MGRIAWRLAGVLSVALAASSPVWAAASEFPILDDHAPQLTTPAMRAAYDKFVTFPLPRAFAVAPNGFSGSRFDPKASIEQIRDEAVASCAKNGGVGCVVYAENLNVVAAGHGWTAPVVPGPLIDNGGYAFVPDQRYLWHGPQAARGLLVWSHGKGGKDERGQQTQPYVRWFNNAGFDIVRFDRAHDVDDKDHAAQWLRDGLKQLRAEGYKMVIAAGQSRGAWNSLMSLDTPGLSDVVIAVSPAAQGTSPGSVLQQGPELNVIANAVHAPTTRVAFVQFLGDPFSANQDMRAQLFHDIIFPHAAAGLIIDRPEGFSGHGGARDLPFGEKFGACLLHFAIDPKPPSGC